MDKLTEFICDDLIPCEAVCFIPDYQMDRYKDGSGPYCPSCDGQMRMVDRT